MDQRRYQLLIRAPRTHLGTIFALWVKKWCLPAGLTHTLNWSFAVSFYLAQWHYWCIFPMGAFSEVNDSSPASETQTFPLPDMRLWLTERVTFWTMHSSWDCHKAIPPINLQAIRGDFFNHDYTIFTAARCLLLWSLYESSWAHTEGSSHRARIASKPNSYLNWLQNSF